MQDQVKKMTRIISATEIETDEMVLTAQEVQTLGLESETTTLRIVGLMNGKQECTIYFDPERSVLEGLAEFYMVHQIYPNQFELGLQVIDSEESRAFHLSLRAIDDLFANWGEALEQFALELDQRIDGLQKKLKRSS